LASKEKQGHFLCFGLNLINFSKINVMLQSGNYTMLMQKI